MQKINQKYIKTIVRQALREDLRPSGDITTRMIINKKVTARIIAGQKCIIGGLNFAKEAFKISDKKISFKAKTKDGRKVNRGKVIAIGSAIDKALGNRSGITRFSFSSVPMDESLAETSIDLVKRQYHKITLLTKRTKIEGMSKEDLEHFFFSLAQNLNCCIHVTVKYGDNDHHKIEAAMKSMAVAIRNAASNYPKQKGIPSTKGAM